MIAALLLALGLQHWLVVNDIHLNPFSQAGIVRGADTTPALWRVAVPAMRRAVPDARVVVLGGDMLAHHFASLAHAAHEHPDGAALGVNRTIASALGAAFPRAQFIVAEGNNDDPCGDYESETGGAYQRALTRIWAPLVDREHAAPGFAASFLHGGYYTVHLPIQRGTGLVLNSVMWSIVYRGGCQSRAGGAPAAEFAWLRAQLRRIGPGEHAVAFMHIPPGYDPSSTMLARRFLAVPFLKPADTRALLDALVNSGRVRALFAAHTHRYDFRVWKTLPIFIASSISPVYHNNPAFYDVTVDERGTVVDIVPYVFDLFQAQWIREPSFDAMYHVSSFDAPALARIAGQIRSDDAVRATWKRAYDVWSWRVGDLDNDWLPFACAQTDLEGTFASCAQTVHRTTAAIAVAAALFALVLAGLGWWLLRGRRGGATRSR